MNSGLDLSNGALPAPPLGDETADLGPQLWRSCLEQLAQELPEQQFNTWLKPLTVRVSDDLTQVTVDSHPIQSKNSANLDAALWPGGER